MVTIIITFLTLSTLLALFMLTLDNVVGPGVVLDVVVIGAVINQLAHF
jgi:hypothetical protein